MDYNQCIGLRVSKRPTKSNKAPKPFKSGMRENTVKGVINHPQLGVPAYTFLEDESYVACEKCYVAVDRYQKMQGNDFKAWFTNRLIDRANSLTRKARRTKGIEAIKQYANTGSRMYRRAGVIDLDEFLKHVNRGKKEMVFQGHSIKMKSLRYKTFKRSLVCVCCGIKGKFFAIEKALTQTTGRYHVNLYAIASDGSEVLMTKDHKLPKSKGGTDKQDNLQTMCANCNTKKGNQLIFM